MTNGLLLARWRDRWSRNLVRFLRRRVHPSVDVEDLAQETYLRLLRAPDLSSVLNPEAYLIRVASNVIADWRHNQAAVETLDPADIENLADPCTPELTVSAQISQRNLATALAELPALTRAVLLLRLRDRVPYKDIARKIGITDRQVKRHLARGYDRLRQTLEL